MYPSNVRCLLCPVTGRPLVLETVETDGARVRTGWLTEPEGGNRYPIVNFIPRFVPSENYASSFGYEWNVHRRTQYDANSLHDLSRERFFAETGWPREMKGEIILEAGSGLGRFSEHALSTGARVVSFDFSNAVEANYQSNGMNENFLLVQADIFNMPFPPQSFDRVFCFGMLQHTPDPRTAFMKTTRMLKPGGVIASDIYIKNLTKWFLQPKYYVRPFIDKTQPERLYKAIVRYVDAVWPLAKIIGKIPIVGPSLNWKLLIADYSRSLPNADERTLREWAYLDTFDMLSPEYDYPQTVATFRQWHVQAGLVDIDVHRGYNGVEGRGKAP